MALVSDRSLANPTHDFPFTKRNHPHHRSKPHNHGLTLIELLVTICIVSILTALTTVSFKPLWDKHRLSLAARETTDIIQLLRMKAIIKKRTFQLKLVDNDFYYRQKKDQGWEAWLKKEMNDVARYSMKGTSSFYSKGFASPKTITLNVNNYHQKIIININGRTRTTEIY